jgi:hypothetical protein
MLPNFPSISPRRRFGLAGTVGDWIVEPKGCLASCGYLGGAIRVDCRETIFQPPFFLTHTLVTRNVPSSKPLR